MSHRIVGFSAVILGLPLAAACHNSSSPPPAEPAPQAAAEPAPAESTQAQAAATGPECETTPPPAPPPTAKAAKVHHHVHVLNCPMDTPGTTAQFVEIDGNPAINFATTGDVVDLRRRVHAFMEPQQPSGTIEPGVSADTQGEGGTRMKPDIAYVGVRSRFEDVPHGIRVIYTPADDGQAAHVHASIAATAAKLDSGDCTDMHMHGVKIKNITPPPP